MAGRTYRATVSEMRTLRGFIVSDSYVVVSTLQGGCFFGSLIAYYIADRWGRKVRRMEQLQRKPNTDKTFSLRC